MLYDEQTNTTHLKILVYGPALSGKTTFLTKLFQGFDLNEQLIPLKNTVYRSFFDYGVIRQSNVFLHICGTGGHQWYGILRSSLLREVDGIIFVADAQKKAYTRNLQSWNELRLSFGKKLYHLPIIVALNKQNLDNKFDPHLFLEAIQASRHKQMAIFPIIALTGKYSMDLIESLLELIPKKYFK